MEESFFFPPIKVIYFPKKNYYRQYGVFGFSKYKFPCASTEKQIKRNKIGNYPNTLSYSKKVAFCHQLLEYYLSE